MMDYKFLETDPIGYIIYQAEHNSSMGTVKYKYFLSDRKRGRSPTASDIKLAYMFDSEADAIKYIASKKIMFTGIRRYPDELDESFYLFLAQLAKI